MINLVYAGNDNTFDGVMISLLSVIKYHKNPLNVYILTMDRQNLNSSWKAFSEEHKEYLLKIIQEVNKESKITVIDTGDIYERTIQNGKNQLTCYTPYCMLRLFLDQIDGLPDKMLYLDYDTVACKDIQELWDIDLQDYEFAGAKDYYGRFFINRNYINSGVLLINLKRVKETKLFERCLELLKVKKLFLPDQSALNNLATKKMIINRKYNEQHKVYKDTIIRHFSAIVRFFPIVRKQNIKVWHIEKVHKVLKCHDFDDILDKYLELKKNFENQGENNGK